MQCPVDLDGNVVVDDGTVVVVEAVVEAVVEVVVEVEVVVVVEPPVMTNPQPRAGSFRDKGSETGPCVVTVVEGGAVLDVVVVTPVDVDVVVDEVMEEEEVVVDDVDDDEFLDTSRPTPVITRPNSTTRRTNRNGHRRAEEVFRDAGTLRHGNSQSPYGGCRDHSLA